MQSTEEPPARLLPEAWVERFEAHGAAQPGLPEAQELGHGLIGRAFGLLLLAARVGAELEQWFAEAIERVFHARELC